MSMNPARSATTDSKTSTKIKDAMNISSAKTVAGMAALKRAMNEVKPPQRSGTVPTVSPIKANSSNVGPSTKTKPQTQHTLPSPFSKTDRLVVSSLESSTSAHLQAIATSISPSHSPKFAPSLPRTPSPTLNSCKTDVLLNAPKLNTTSYAPPPLFAH